MIKTLQKINTLEYNIHKFAALMVFDKRVYGAILSLYFLSINNVFEFHIGWIIFAGCLAAFLFEIPSGYLSDKMGHKKALVLARVLVILSTLSYLFATNIYYLIGGSVLFSISLAFMSGTTNAFMHDTLKELKKEEQYSKIMGKISAIGYAIPTLFMASASFLASYDYRYIFIVSLVIDILGLLTVLTLVSPTKSSTDLLDIKSSKLIKILKEGFAIGYVPFALLGGFMGGALIGIRGYVDPFQQISGADIAYFGIFLAVSRLLSSIVSMYSKQVKEYFNIYSFNMFRIVLFSILFISLGFVYSWQSVVFIMILINTINLGLHQVNNHYDLELIQTSKFKATLLSIKGQISQVFLAFTSLGLGYFLTYYSYQQSFMFLGFLFFIVCSLIIIYILNKHNLCYNLCINKHNIKGK
jgi:MFS family permease